MPFMYDSFIYDFSTAEYLKEALKTQTFFNNLDHYHSVPNAEIDSEGYAHFKYFDEREHKFYDAGSNFGYRINSDFFRDKHFEKLKLEDYNVLALGCSFTFGSGLPEEYVWPRILESEMQKFMPETKVFNLGSPGIGIDVIINNAIAFIDKYGTPDAIFALFPDMNRKMYYEPLTKKYEVYVARFSHFKLRKEQRTLHNKTKIYNFEDSAYDMINHIKILESFCRVAGIKLVWHSWPENDIELYSAMNFKKYTTFDNFYFENKENILESVPEEYLQYMHGARDDFIHPGIEYNVNVTGLFLDRWKRF
jgi:hypothetical protein